MSLDFSTVKSLSVDNGKTDVVMIKNSANNIIWQKPYAISKTATNCSVTVASTAKYGNAVNVSWTPASEMYYDFTLNNVNVYGQQNGTDTLLKSFTTGTSGSFTMNGKYYDNVLVNGNYTKSEKETSLMTMVNSSGNTRTITLTSSSNTSGTGVAYNPVAGSNNFIGEQSEYFQRYWVNNVGDSDIKSLLGSKIRIIHSFRVSQSSGASFSILPVLQINYTTTSGSSATPNLLFTYRDFYNNSNLYTTSQMSYEFNVDLTTDLTTTTLRAITIGQNSTTTLPIANTSDYKLTFDSNGHPSGITITNAAGTTTTGTINSIKFAYGIRLMSSSASKSKSVSVQTYELGITTNI